MIWTRLQVGVDQDMIQTTEDSGLRTALQDHGRAEDDVMYTIASSTELVYPEDLVVSENLIEAIASEDAVAQFAA